jgi:sugar-specific transcriptional regulator TrmB
MTSWDKLLHTLGFTDSESRLYLVSLEAGPATVQDLAKKAKISRVTAYAAIDALMRNGLMSTVQQGKKRLLAAESPDRLIAFMHTRMQNMQTTLKEVEASVDELRLLQRGEKPIVKMFKGKEGIRAFQNDVLEVAPKAMEEIANFDECLRLYPTEADGNQEYFDKLDKLRPKRRLIFYSNGEHKIRGGFPDEHIAIIKETGPSKFFADIQIYGNRIALSTLRGEIIYILIESQDLADAFREIFNRNWNEVQDKRIC